MPKFEQMPGGETPVAEKPEETILEKMRGRAKKLYLALGFLSAFSGAGMSREAMAEEVRKKPDVASKINLDSIRRADLPEGKGEVLFAQTDEKEIALDGKTGKRQATMIEVTDEGDPKVKGDELKIKGFLYKFKAKNETIWDTKISAEGRLRFFENPLGKFDPTKRKASLGISMDRDIFNSDLLQIWYMKRLAEGMKYVG
ncbi:hypothetical protein KJ885_01615, partial [Patescibacteria group bacterium]|nr:hypothetical protein [Patescibacteria group bacterium]